MADIATAEDGLIQATTIGIGECMMPRVRRRTVSVVRLQMRDVRL